MEKEVHSHLTNLSIKLRTLAVYLTALIAAGTEAHRRLAIQTVYGAMRDRITVFVLLPLESPVRALLQNRVDAISKQKEETV